MRLTNKIIISLTLILLLLSACQKINGQTNIVKAFPNLTFSSPIDIQSSNDNSNRLFVVSQTGMITVFENDSSTSSSSIFLDITDKVEYGGEMGLLGLAFHPDYISNGYFYINYTRNNPLRTVISRFSVSSNDKDNADKLSEQIILEVEQPFQNHNGGQISFGPDGYLYTSLGDGGSGGDPGNRSQNLSTLLGKIVRIDVNNQTNGKQYSIPNDNPFHNNQEGFLEEIYAYGLRNTWRFSFDSQNRLWAAEVGQNAWEEINLIEKGGNYGWRIMEGFHCYNPSSNCNKDGLILPVWEYDHSSSGGYSITGGYVYEGENIPGLKNKYIYADFVTGNLWSLDLSNSANPNSLITKFNGQISCFGIDENKDLYFADYNTGNIYKIIGENTNSVKPNKSSQMELGQNYPNPFNPSTTINYAINNSVASSLVVLELFNSIGENLGTLINQFQTNGNYKFDLNVSSLMSSSTKLRSGVYFYRLRVGQFSQTKKMTLLN